MGGFADVLADLLGLPGAEQSDVSPDLELATELELAELAAELETADPMAAAVRHQLRLPRRESGRQVLLRPIRRQLRRR